MIDEEQLVALTRDKAAAIAGITERQVDYWSRTGLVRPAIDRRLTPQRPVRLYGYVDLMSLMVAAELRRRGVSLQHIRKVVEFLRARGYERPLTQVAFATLGGEVYLQHPDGTWESSLRPDQVVIHQVIDLEPLRARIRSTTTREPSRVGQTERRRGVMGSKPVIAGTRVPVDTVRRYLKRGATTEQVLGAFPVLQREDVEAVRRELPAA